MISEISYAARTASRMLYHANDTSRDTVTIDSRAMPIHDARGSKASLDFEGFQIISDVMATQILPADGQTSDSRQNELASLLTQVTGADLVTPTGRGIQRFSERSPLCGTLDNSRPARFAHVDVSGRTAETFSRRFAPGGQPRPSRSAHYNIWSILTPPPQDVPLALCDARTVSPDDLLPADAIFDRNGEDLWSFEGLVLAHSPRHRWCWFSNMSPGEALVFKTYDSAPDVARCVPHVAFDNPDAKHHAVPRASIEQRAIAYWF